jgi:nucleoside phosphorylase
LRQSRTLHTLTFGPISGIHFSWQEGKSVEGADGEEFEVRSKSRNSSEELGKQIEIQLENEENELTDFSDAFSRSKEYISLREKFGARIARQPKVRSGLIVSGSSVVASDETANEILRRHPGALGLEMEIFAVYTAAYLGLGRKPEYIAIKGVADFADREKTDDSQKLASELAAETFRRILQKWSLREK